MDWYDHDYPFNISHGRCSVNFEYFLLILSKQNMTLSVVYLSRTSNVLKKTGNAFTYLNFITYSSLSYQFMENLSLIVRHLSWSLSCFVSHILHRDMIINTVVRCSTYIYQFHRRRDRLLAWSQIPITICPFQSGNHLYVASSSWFIYFSSQCKLCIILQLIGMILSVCLCKRIEEQIYEDEEERFQNLPM